MRRGLQPFALPAFIIFLFVPSMLPAIASAPQATAVPREAMSMLLSGPEHLSARPFDLRVGAAPPDFPADVLPAGAVVQVSAGGDRVSAVVAVLARFAADDRAAFEQRLAGAGWINPLLPAGFSAPVPRANLVVCRGDRFATLTFAPRREGGTWARASVVTDAARPCVAQPRAIASQTPLPALAPPAGARGAHASIGGTPDAMYSSVRLDTRQTVAEVAAHYAAQLAAAGWTVDGRSSDAAAMAVTRLRTSGAAGERITGLLVVTALDGSSQMDVLFRIVQPAVQ